MKYVHEYSFYTKSFMKIYYDYFILIFHLYYKRNTGLSLKSAKYERLESEKKYLLDSV